jgi:hypothetical protein
VRGILKTNFNPVDEAGRLYKSLHSNDEEVEYGSGSSLSRLAYHWTIMSSTIPVDIHYQMNIMNK